MRRKVMSVVFELLDSFRSLPTFERTIPMRRLRSASSFACAVRLLDALACADNETRQTHSERTDS